MDETFWTVLEVVGRYSRCRCACGTERLVATRTLKTGASTSCGCRKKLLAKKGPDSPSWKGDDICRNQGHTRAQKAYPSLGICESCGERPAVDRHHKDDNTANNARSNVLFVCRPCHMEIDGRAAKLAELARANAAKNIKPPSPCENCGRPYKPLRRGRCHACNEFYRRHGRERTPEDGVRSGENSGRSKLSESQVAEIRSRRSGGRRFRF